MNFMLRTTGAEEEQTLRFYFMQATELNEAAREAHELIIGNPSDEQRSGFDGIGWWDDRIRDAELIAYTKCTELPVAEWYRDAEASHERKLQEACTAVERAQYERLKAKFER